MFSQASVILFTGGHAWQGGVHGRGTPCDLQLTKGNGACRENPYVNGQALLKGGPSHNFVWEACMKGGIAWSGGACVSRGACTGHRNFVV